MVKAREHTVLGVFEDQEHASKARRALVAAGFPQARVRLVSQRLLPSIGREAVGLQQLTDKGAWEGTLIGGGIGALIGLALGFLPATQHIFLWMAPALAPWNCGVLMGLAAGAALGTFTGPFLAGEWYRTHHPVSGHDGQTALVVHADQRTVEARTLLLENGAYDDSMRADE